MHGTLRNMLISADQSQYVLQPVSQITLSQFCISQITWKLYETLHRHQIYGLPKKRNSQNPRKPLTYYEIHLYIAETI